jgi:hypothetical protein
VQTLSCGRKKKPRASSRCSMATIALRNRRSRSCRLRLKPWLKRENLPQPKRGNLSQPKRGNLSQPKRQNLPQPKRGNLPQPKRENLSQLKRENLPQLKRENLPQPKRGNLPQPKRGNLSQQLGESHAPPERRERKSARRRDDPCMIFAVSGDPILCITGQIQAIRRVDEGSIDFDGRGLSVRILHPALPIRVEVQ